MEAEGELIDVDKLKNVKRSTVAIGLAERNQLPLVVLGTGFFVSSDALIMSAAHVFNECKRAKQYIRENHGKDLDVVASFAYGTNLEQYILSVRIGKVTILQTKSYDLGYVGPLDFDISVAQLEGKSSKPLAYLDTKATNAELYQEVAICGYPQGTQSFALLDSPSGLKLSPIVQLGHISGFMPFDDADIPYGVQTDIVGTGGSSGSPIVGMSGELLGVAQRVISADVSESTSSQKLDNEPQRFARIGITYGFFNRYFPEMLNSARDFLETGTGGPIDFKYTGLPNMKFKVI